MSIAALRELASTENDDVLTEMLTAGLDRYTMYRSLRLSYSFLPSPSLLPFSLTYCHHDCWTFTSHDAQDPWEHDSNQRAQTIRYLLHFNIRLYSSFDCIESYLLHMPSIYTLCLVTESCHRCVYSGSSGLLSLLHPFVFCVVLLPQNIIK